MFSSVIFRKPYEPNKHNALSLARVLESKPNIITLIRKARCFLMETELRAT